MSLEAGFDFRLLEKFEIRSRSRSLPDRRSPTHLPTRDRLSLTTAFPARRHCLPRSAAVASLSRLTTTSAWIVVLFRFRHHQKLGHRTTAEAPRAVFTRAESLSLSSPDPAVSRRFVPHRRHVQTHRPTSFLDLVFFEAALLPRASTTAAETAVGLSTTSVGKLQSQPLDGKLQSQPFNNWLITVLP
ncbi:hypothetical protein ACOSQ3_018984 [Xanthoceras sorbifolium]